MFSIFLPQAPTSRTGQTNSNYQISVWSVCGTLQSQNTDVFWWRIRMEQQILDAWHGKHFTAFPSLPYKHRNERLFRQWPRTSRSANWQSVIREKRTEKKCYNDTLRLCLYNQQCIAVLKRLVNVGLLTSIGVLVDANAVNPTMSQKKMVTSSNCSAWTDVNNLRWSATGLNRKKMSSFEWRIQL